MLSKQLLDFAEKEKISVSTSKHIKDFAHNLAAVQDYRDAEVRVLLKQIQIYYSNPFYEQ